MKFKETFARLTGISVPFFGVQWRPPEADRAVAKRVIALLEDRRVLYAPSEMEVPEHCVHSVIEIRSFLTRELGKLESTSELASNLRVLRAENSWTRFRRMAIALSDLDSRTATEPVGSLTAPSAK